MVTRLRSSLTYANVMATIAVFAALGGGAYAATKLPKNSVSTAQVRNGSLLKKDFKRGQLPAGPQGPKGDKGDPGSQGLPGPNGKDGLSGTNGLNGKDGTNGKDGVNGKDAATHVRYAVGSSGGVTNSSSGATAKCDQPGEKMIGGGGGFVGAFTETFDSASTHVISYNGPMGNPGEAAQNFENATAWVVQGTNTTAVVTRIYAYAICVSP